MIACGVLPSAGAALSAMSTIIDDLVERVKKWPAWRQADAVYLLEMLEESGTDMYRLSNDERSAVREGLASPAVSDADVEAFRNRHKA